MFKEKLFQESRMICIEKPSDKNDKKETLMRQGVKKLEDDTGSGFVLEPRDYNAVQVQHEAISKGIKRNHSTALDTVPASVPVSEVVSGARDYSDVQAQHEAISKGIKGNHPADFPDKEIADNLSEKDFDSIFSSLTIAKLINLKKSYDSKDPQKNYNFVNKELLGSLATEADVIALQKYLKVNPDGKIGPKTLDAMQNKWLLLNEENISKPETVAYGLANFYSLGANYLNKIFGKVLPENLKNNFTNLYDYMGSVSSNSDFNEVINLFNLKFKEAFDKIDPENNKEKLSTSISAIDLNSIENSLFKKIHFEIKRTLN